MYTLDKKQGDVTMVEEYEKRIEIILKQLGIVTTNSNSNWRKYAEVESNAFNEIRNSLYTHTFLITKKTWIKQSIICLKNYIWLKINN